MWVVAVTDAERLAAALVAAGYDPPPYVGEDWIDRGATWLPDGHLQIVRITAIGNTISGWQARVRRREVDAGGNVVDSGCGSGVIYLDHLVGRRFADVFHYERMAVSA